MSIAAGRRKPKAISAGHSRSPSPSRVCPADERFARKITRMVRESPSLFTAETLEQAECKALDDGYRQTRRLGFGVLTHPGADLMDLISNDRETAVAVAEFDEHLRRYIQHLRELLTMMEAAEARIGVALAQREYMDEVTAEGRAAYDGPRDTKPLTPLPWAGQGRE